MLGAAKRQPLRAAPKDRQPPTATNHQIAKRQPPPTANNRQPPTAANCKPLFNGCRYGGAGGQDGDLTGTRHVLAPPPMILRRFGVRLGPLVQICSGSAGGKTRVDIHEWPAKRRFDSRSHARHYPSHPSQEPSNGTPGLPLLFATKASAATGVSSAVRLGQGCIRRGGGGGQRGSERG